MDNDLVSAVATAIKNKRLELINQPLARIYNDLALAAISVLVKEIEPRNCVDKEIPIPTKPTADPAAKESIKRYIINYDARGEQEHPSGDFVHHADHVAALRNLIEERDAERARAEEAEAALRETRAALEPFTTPPLYVLEGEARFVPKEMPDGWIGGGWFSSDDFRRAFTAYHRTSHVAPAAPNDSRDGKVQ